MAQARSLAVGILSCALIGCAQIRTEHQVVRGTPSRETIALGPPLLTKTAVTGSTIDVHVSPGKCLVQTTTPVVEKDRISRHPSAASTITFLGLGAGIGGLGYVAWNRADDLPKTCPEGMGDDKCTTREEQQVLAGLLWAGGAALAGYGIYDLIRGERDVQEKETANRKEVERSAPQACVVAMDGHAVEVRLSGGQTLKQLTDSTGSARFQVPEAVLQASGANLRATVTVNGRAADPADLSALVAAYRRAHPVRVALGGQDSRYLFLNDAKFVAASPPAVSEGKGAPRILDIRATEKLINGGAAFIEFDVEDPDGERDIDRILVVTEGDAGYYLIPSQPGPGGQRRVRLGIRDTVTDAQMRIGFALLDRGGHVSNYEFRSFPIVRTGTGDLKVSLTFDRSTDLDLHVVEPSKESIFFGMRESRTGGELDLDSNAGCQIDGVNNENVFWKTGTAPAGEYKVYVQNFRSCLREPVNYLVTVYNGRNIQTFEGTIGNNDPKPRLITTFERPAAAGAPPAVVASEPAIGTCAKAAACCSKVIKRSRGGAPAEAGCAALTQLPEASCVHPLQTSRESAKALGLRCD
ncbi:MAG TPA: hypothetical protein VHP33_32205 [Polyangiaceae bacterium]|nr:hypothetical protein [Polyangiaceae bacterium]